MTETRASEREEVSFYVFKPDEDESCGERCDRKADIEINGLVYCAPCLDGLLAAGSIFVEAMDEARVRGAKLSDTKEAG